MYGLTIILHAGASCLAYLVTLPSVVGREPPSLGVHGPPAALVVVARDERIPLADATIDAAEVMPSVGVELKHAVGYLARVACVDVAGRDTVGRAVEECAVLAGGRIVPYVDA